MLLLLKPEYSLYQKQPEHFDWKFFTQAFEEMPKF